MIFFRKKCKYCKEKINKGEEVWEKVKVPEFTGLRIRAFCSREHAEFYKKNIKGTPVRKCCPSCGL